MKKFLIAAISCILLYLLLDTAYYRWGIYFDFHREQDIEVFAATQGKEHFACVTGPLGERVKACWGMSGDGVTAVI